MRRVLTALLENESGALSRVVDLFSARGYNIDSLTVAPTQDPTLSRLTVVTCGGDGAIEQITKQMNKLIEVYKVTDITEERHIEREVMLIKTRAEGPAREEMRRLCEIFRGVVVNVTPSAYIMQITGDKKKLDAFLEAVGDDAVIEIARTGVCGMSRGA
jgi:acetolactate synthase-1/3 small subunit